MTDLERLLRAGPPAREHDDGRPRTGPRPRAGRSGELPDIARAAAAEGLLDVAYAKLDSPLGALLLARTPRGLVRLAYLDDPGAEELVLADLAAKVSPRVLASSRALDDARRELEEYFGGKRHRFELELDWRLTAGFGRRVLDETARIPYGSAWSYKQVATSAGSPRASRAAGNALGANPMPIVVPCHRVLHSTGALGGYTGGLERKRALLQIEGVTNRTELRHTPS